MRLPSAQYREILRKRRQFSAKKKTATFRKWFHTQISSQHQKCPICGCHLEIPEKSVINTIHVPNLATVDHIQPLSEGGLNEYSNFRIICQTCNVHLGKIARIKRLTAVIKRDTMNVIEEKTHMTKSIVEYMNQEAVKKNIQDAIGDKTPQYIASVASLVNSNPAIAECDQKSIMSACLIAASLDLPINQNLGFAYIIPYKRAIKDEKGQITGYEMLAQFQMGYKGFIQLAMRSGQFKTINVTDVRDGELKDNNRLTGEMEFDWLKENREQAIVVGYVAYMELTNGFRKMLYMSNTSLKEHGTRFSQSMKRGYGLWKDDFNSMAMKTVIKLLLSKYAPMTVEMQKAQLADQAVAIEGGSYQYPDNQPVDANEVAQGIERERIVKHIEISKSLTELQQCELAVNDFPDQSGELVKLFNDKRKELGGK